MHDLCTVSDESFMIKGHALYESLAEKSKDFILHYLCIDNESFAKAQNKEDLKFYLVDNVIKDDAKMLDLRKNNYKYFCWSLASYFSNWLLNQNSISEITYIDSDIFFHKPINVIFEEIKDKEIGLFRHRMFSFEERRGEGWFNVGVVHFKNTSFGRTSLNWWAESVKNQLYPELSTCGDQKYLDVFLNPSTKDLVFIDGEIGHGAPWHWQIYNLDKYIESGKIVWGNKEQDLVFTHFSQFRPDYANNTYLASAQHHCYTPLSEYSTNKRLKHIYDCYFDQLKSTKEKYGY